MTTKQLKHLKPFQRIGVEFLKNNYHALLADEMGLGKTVQALIAFKELKLKSGLIICPASVRLNWRREISDWGLDNRMFDVISYNGASSHVIRRELRKRYDMCILDEVHYLKTPESKRTKSVFGNKAGLARRCTRIMGLSGTPILNRPRELFVILKCLATERIKPYDHYERFMYRYCGAFFDGYRVNDRGHSNLEELKGRLTGFMLRRTKSSVLKELPAKSIKHVPLERDAKDFRELDLMEMEIADRKAFISSAKEGYAQLGDLARLRRATGMAKVPAMIKYIKDLLETVDKVVVFTWHRDVLSQLVGALDIDCDNMAVTYQGGYSDLRKQGALKSFIDHKKCKVFIGNIQAAGTGIDGLQKVCSNVVFAEMSWVPGEMNQAMDRIHRMGQTNPVTVHIPYVEGTLESAMIGVHKGKEAVIEQVVGNSEVLGDFL